MFFAYIFPFVFRFINPSAGWTKTHTLFSMAKQEKRQENFTFLFFFLLFSASFAPKKEEKTLLDPRNNVMLSSTLNCRFGICVGHGAAAHTTHSEPSKKRRNNFFSIVTYSSHKFNSREHKKEIEMCYRRERKICVSDEKRHGVWDWSWNAACAWSLRHCRECELNSSHSATLYLLSTSCKTFLSHRHDASRLQQKSRMMNEQEEREKAGEKQREIIKLFCQESWLLCELVCVFFSGHESDWIFHIPKWLCGDPWQQQQRDEEAALGAHLKNWKISLFPLALTHFNRIWESEHKKLFRIQKFFHYRLWNDILYSFSFSFLAKRPKCQF